MKIRINDMFKIGIMSLSEIIGIEKMEMLAEGLQVEITEDELNMIKQLPENYQEAIEIITEEVE